MDGARLAESADALHELLLANNVEMRGHYLMEYEAGGFEDSVPEAVFLLEEAGMPVPQRHKDTADMIEKFFEDRRQAMIARSQQTM